MKKIMLLGGSYFQASAVRRAKELGYYVITADYLPDNPGHKYADEYHNVSTIDKEAILKLARELEIDGILAYASDVSVPTAAYVAEQMGLPTNPLHTQLVLARKDLFRPFLRENGFYGPQAESFTDYESAYAYAKKLNKKILLKPVDASGSKGITVISDLSQFRAAYEEAYDYSICKTVLVEEFMERKGYQYTGDGLIVDGKLIYMGMSKEHLYEYRCNGNQNMIPSGESFPAYLDEKVEKDICDQCQRVFDLLGFRFGTVNLEFFVTQDDKPMILEIAPRSGGNLMPDAIRINSGIDMIEYCIRMAVGDPVPKAVEPERMDNVSTFVIHALKTGTFREVWISDEIRDNIVMQDILAREGQAVEAFKNGGKMVGAMILRFDSKEDMEYKMDHMHDYVKVLVD